MKRWISLLLCAGLLAACAACTPTEKTDGSETEALLATGRYMESEIALPLPDGFSGQQVLGAQQTDGGWMVFTAASSGEGGEWRLQYYRHTVATDGTVVTADEAWLNALAPRGGNELHICCGGDGAIYMCYSDYDENGNPVPHILVSHDGGQTGEELSGDGVRSVNMLTGMGVFSDGSIVIADFYDGNAFLLDGSGKRMQELSSDNRGRIKACAAGGTYAAFTVPSAKLVRVYDAKTQSYTDYETAFSDLDSAQLAVDSEGSVYLIDNTGIYRHTFGGTIWEKLVDGGTNTIGLPDFYPVFLTLDAETPYASFYVGGGEQLLSYRYDAKASTNADKELNVFSLYANETVQQAIVAFSRARSDVKITYTVAMESASGGTEQDYSKALNTELLAGTGPDILILDHLPVASYVEKGVLADLTQTLADAEPALANIVGAFRADDALYAVPTGFTLPIAIAMPGTETAFSSLSALADAAEADGALPLLSKCAFSYKTLAYYLIRYYGGALETGRQEEIERFLLDAERVSNAIGCTDKIAEGWDALKSETQDGLYENFRDHIGAPQVFACASGLARDVLGNPIGSVSAGMEMLELATQTGAGTVDIAGQFIPMGIAGINKASGEPEAAKAFLQTLLSYGAQGGNQYASQFPVNVQALSEMLAFDNPNVSSGMVLNDSREFNATWPSEAMRERLGTLIAGVDTPIVSYAALDEMLLPKVEGYLSGMETMEQAAGAIVSLMATYLSE